MYRMQTELDLKVRHVISHVHAFAKKKKKCNPAASYKSHSSLQELRSRASKTWRHHGSSWFVTMLRHFDSKHSTKKRREKINRGRRIKLQTKSPGLSSSSLVLKEGKIKPSS